MRTAAGPNAAREKHMAMRWSSQVPMCASRQPRTGGVTRSQSGPDSTVAPSFSSSVCMAWIRSVSFTRQLPMLRSRHGPSAYRGQRGRGHGRVGDQVEIGIEGLEPLAVGDVHATDLDPVRTVADRGAHIRQRLGKAHVALDAVGAHAADPQRTAADRAQRQEIGRRGRVTLDRDAAGCGRRRRADHEAAQPSRRTVTPKRAIRFSVISI